MVIFSLLPTIIYLAIGIITVLLQEKWHDKRTGWHRKVVISLVVLMVFSAVANGVFIWMDAKQSQSISDSITGGNSYCLFIYPRLPEEETGNTTLAALIHEGQYPLRELKILIFDVGKKAEQNRYMPVFFTAKPGPGEVRFELLKLPPDQDWQSFEISYSAVNGSWHQKVTFRRVNQIWQLANRVTKDNGKTILYEQVDPNFPRDSVGNVIW